MFRWFQTSHDKLIEAIKAKNTVEAERLIAEIDATELSKIDKNGDTVLTWAAWKGLDKVCEALISKMSNEAINHIDNDGDTALTLAVSNGLDKVCEALISKMSPQAINTVTKTYGNTALILAASKELDKVCELLIPKMSNEAINQVNKNGDTALTWAASNGLDKVCEALISKMSPQAINHVNNNGDTVLSIAKGKGFKNISDLLMNQQTLKHDQLISAIKEDKIEEAKNLISLINSDYFNKVDNYGNTTLHYAVDKNLKTLSLLLIQRMNNETVSIGNKYNNTALHYATNNGLEEVSWFLINKMTQKALDMVNTDGNTALDYAIYNKLIITGLLAKKMSLEAVKKVNPNCKAEDLASIKDYQSLEQYNKTREHEKVIAKCFPLSIESTSFSSPLEGENIVYGVFGFVTILVAGVVSYYLVCCPKQNINIIDDNLTKWEKLLVAIKEKNTLEAQNLINSMTQEELSKLDNNNNTALFAAASQGLDRVCEVLISKMSDQAINHVANNGETALTWAAGKSLDKACELLIPKMSNEAINYVAKNGETALTWAANKGLEKVCELLISKMSEQAINHVTNNGNTALTLAQQKGFKNICDLLTHKMDKQNNLLIEIDKQNETQESFPVQEEDIFVIIGKLINKIEIAGNIKSKDKDLVQNNILNKIQKLVESKSDMQMIRKSIQKLINKDKITKGILVDLESEFNELIEQQIIINNHICAEKLDVFNKIIAEVITKLQNDNTIGTSNKTVMEDTINKIKNEVSKLTSASDIEKITADIIELKTGKITKGRLADLQEEAETVVLKEINEAGTTIFIAKEIIYNNQLLNYPELLEPSLEKFSLQEIGELSSQLSTDLIQQAISDNDGDVILAGLMSLGNAEV